MSNTITAVAATTAQITARPPRPGIPTQAEIDARAALAADLLETIRDQAAVLFGDDVDGLTLTAAGSLFGAWEYDDTYDLVHTGRVAYVDEDDDLDPVELLTLTANLAAFAPLAPCEHVQQARNGWTLVHLNPAA
ncbi:hypothetical protein [Streptomyces sp. NPDC088739]|uniref:hypothetical protein n=1 Tax=Streptomyces sp. NPDC088739 TaxID=3365882 RepID=UPI0037FF48F0